MRFKLHLELLNSKENILPLNYQYELSAWVYKVLNHGNPEFSGWLHEYSVNRRQMFGINLNLQKMADWFRYARGSIVDLNTFSGKLIFNIISSFTKLFI